jgi:hypothetical protein
MPGFSRTLFSFTFNDIISRVVMGPRWWLREPATDMHTSVEPPVAKKPLHQIDTSNSADTGYKQE